MMNHFCEGLEGGEFLKHAVVPQCFCCSRLWGIIVSAFLNNIILTVHDYADLRSLELSN